jgi:hypothetical protein
MVLRISVLYCGEAEAEVTSYRRPHFFCFPHVLLPSDNLGRDIVIGCAAFMQHDAPSIKESSISSPPYGAGVRR